MWPDNETDRDFLNFAGVADTVAEVVVQAKGRPISIGVSGAWGSGKSSLIKLTRKALDARPKPSDGRKFLFVEFNAWLYQGYDDARAALVDVIASTLAREAEAQSTAVDKVKGFVKRVNWLRVVKLVGSSAVAMSMGLPPMGLIGGVWELGKKMLGGGANAETLTAAEATVGSAAEAAGGLLNPKEASTPPQEIQALREEFQEILDDLKVTLVVLIDDLDRCLPETTISTLEAIRLFLFLRNTAFVIAADDEMIKYAVRRHFVGIDENRADGGQLVINYFDKLIQVPIRVPPLGAQEVRAYMMLLYVENSALTDEVKDKIRKGVCDQLQKTWQGKRVDPEFLKGLHSDLPAELVGKLDTAERLAALMTTSSVIGGNPRLIKRLLNALAIRMTIAKAHGVAVDEAVLAKLLLFERLGDPKSFGKLLQEVSLSADGKPSYLASLESAATAGKELPEDWQAPFMQAWLALPPSLSGLDLRGPIYVSREHAPLITAADRLSGDSAGVLEGLLSNPAMAGVLEGKLRDLPKSDLAIIMDRLLAEAQKEQAWGVPPILEALISVARADPAMGKRIAGFLADRPPAQIQPGIVPKLSNFPWASDVFDTWEKAPVVAGSVKKAITAQRKNGNVSV
ncbi:MAG: ATPase [Planctomycetes bacterium]|nr:ATPase [Planctomycetota bacterium]